MNIDLQFYINHLQKQHAATAAKADSVRESLALLVLEQNKLRKQLNAAIRQLKRLK